MSFYSCGWTVISPPDHELPEGCNRPVATEARPAVLGTVGLQTPVETPPPTPVSGLLPFCLPEPKDNVTSAYSSGAPGLTFPCPLTPHPPKCSFLVPCPAADTQPDGSPASSCPPTPPPGSLSARHSSQQSSPEPAGSRSQAPGLTCHTGDVGWQSQVRMSLKGLEVTPLLTRPLGKFASATPNLTPP